VINIYCGRSVFVVVVIVVDATTVVNS